MYEVFIRVGGQTGQTYFKNIVKHNDIDTIQSGDVMGQTVYETLFTAVSFALSHIESGERVIIYSNNLAFVQSMSHNNQLESLSELKKLLQSHDVTFEFQKMEKLRFENSSVMARKIDVGSEQPERFGSAEELSHNRRINLNCAASIIHFYETDNHMYADYLELKTFGTDAWSSVTPEMFAVKSKENYEKVIKYIPDKIHAAYAMRWYQRGLTLKDAIRKVLIDEQQANRTETKNVVLKPEKKPEYEQLSLQDFLAI